MSKSSSATRPSVFRRLGLASWRGRFAWLAGVLLVAVLVSWMLIRATPGWYRPLDPDDQGVQDAGLRGQTLLYFDLRTATERVPLGEQRWSISQDEMNSFLAVNYSQPLTTAGTRTVMDPARNPVSDPFVVFGNGEITVGARITKVPSGNAQGGVGSARFSVAVEHGSDGEPMGVVKLQRVYAGLLPVPRGLVESRLQALLPVILQASVHVAEVQLGAHASEKTENAVEAIARGVVDGTPFPLHFKQDKKEFVVKEIVVEPGRFTMELAPVKPAVVQLRPLSP